MTTLDTLRMKSYKELGITFAEYGALLGTRQLLWSGQLTHCETNTDNPPPGQHFNMDVAGIKDECGTIACIGGTMAIIMGKVDPSGDVRTLEGAAQHYVSCERSITLDALFYPRENDLSWGRITAEQAVEAIDNFLTTGRPMWHVVLNGYAIDDDED